MKSKLSEKKGRSTKQASTGQGFTIIEVVLVLAIAGLIFLIVFQALPALQRSRRDTARKSDASAIWASVVEYQTNTSSPMTEAIFSNAFTASPSGSFAEYINNLDVQDPYGSNYVYSGSPSSSFEPGNIRFLRGWKCNDSNTAFTNTGVNANDHALLMKLEAGYSCIDSVQ